METIKCGCGCGESIPAYDKSHKRIRQFALGHNIRKERTLFPKPCDVCGKSFSPTSRTQSHCSRKCALLQVGIKRQSRVTLVCVVCKKKYEQHTYRAESSKYCSKTCWSDRTPMTNCRQCGVEFKPVAGHRVIFCSYACTKAHHVGPNAPAWKGGKSLERERGRLSPELKTWRTAVYTRDAYTCQQCGLGGVIHAHHVKPWAECPESRLDVSNGITLCVDCHGKLHGKDFTNRRTKDCPDCGKKTTGRGKQGRCKSCAIRLFHSQRKVQAELPVSP